MEVTKCLKPLDSGHDLVTGARVQAATGVNAEQASNNRCAGRPTGVSGKAEGKRTQHGKPQGVVRDDQRTPVRDRPGARGGGEVRNTAEAG